MLGEHLATLSNLRSETQNVYSKSTLSNKTSELLLPYQKPLTIGLIYSLLKNNCALNASETGTGKTYISVALCKELNRKPIIICPKTIMYSWLSICEYMGVIPYDIVNYETIRNGKTYTSFLFNRRKNASYLKITPPTDRHELSDHYQWNVPNDVLLIIDEAHRCKETNTDNGRLLTSTKQLIRNNIPVLLLSATISEKYQDMKIPFYLFGLISHPRDFTHYIKTLKYKYPTIAKKENYQSIIIHEEIKQFCHRIKISQLGDKFPKNNYMAQEYIINNTDEIGEIYKKIELHLAKLKENPQSNHLAEIQKLKQEIEIKKVPIFKEQAEIYLENNKSVIIFVNYLATLKMLSELLNIRCKIYGEQTLNERENAINEFQCNKERIIICQIRAGGVGISLHDIHGEHPRVTLISCPDSASDLIQALGRAYRTGAKTPVTQRIIFVAGVPQENHTMLNINKKLSNSSMINDGTYDTHLAMKLN